MQIECRIVLAKQPDGHIILAQRQNPYRFIFLDSVLFDAGYGVLAKEAVLLLAVIGSPQVLKGLRSYLAHIQFDALPDYDRRAKCETVDVAQALSFYAQPIAVMAQGLEGLDFDRVVAGDTVVARIRQQSRPHRTA